MQPLCFVKAFNFALGQQGIASLPERELAMALDLTVPNDLASTFPYAAISDDPKNWGVHVGENSDLLRRFLADNNIKVLVTYLPGASIPRDSFSTLLSDNISAGQSAIVGFRHTAAAQNFPQLGHASAVVSASSKIDRIELYESETGVTEEIFGPALYGAMRVVDGGVWLIGPTHSSASILYPS